MRTLAAQELRQNPALYEEIGTLLQDEGILCFPSQRSYRLAAPLFSEKAVIQLLQIKRRTKQAPALVFLPHAKSLESVAETIPPGTRSLLQDFWPGPLTIVIAVNSQLPKKIQKNLCPDNKLAVRVPEEEIAQSILRAFPHPLLISSANLSRKVGENSEAQVKKNFGNLASLLISSGDLPTRQPSTVVDVTSDPPRLLRPGAVDFELVLASWSPQAH